jgi:(1->4)-alpha-D-glucan 1-alpha-D-glucosylmutase
MKFPESTYRLQFHAGFTFRDAAAIVPYLHELGITHVYASPYFRAVAGSTHGYDVTSHAELNPEVGSEADYEAFLAALREHGMSHILDTVPNHMGVATNDNAWWNDVLENGPASTYAHYFDIAWRESPRPELQDKVLLPVLGALYGEVLEKGELKLAFDNGGFGVKYYERRFPVDPRTYGLVLSEGREELERTLGPRDPIASEFRGLMDRLADDDPKAIKAQLATIAKRSAAIHQFVERNVAAINGTPGDTRSFDRLDELLSGQHYRLAWWRTASDEINYRRFFDINDLAALSMEHEEVFRATHERILRLLAEGKIAGLRIDHPDGLYDPKQYFRRLQEHYARTTGTDAEGRPLYVLVEKILAMEEELPRDWTVHGTSGYDFLIHLNNLFVDPSGREEMTRVYEHFVGDETPFSEIVYEKKKLILRISLASELNMLAHRFDRFAQRHRKTRDFTLNALRDALREAIACYPVYRSYVSDEGVSETDVRHTEQAVNAAIERNPKTDAAIYHFIRDTLLQKDREGYTEEDRNARLRLVGRFQQLTAPATAKGIEDTAFYVYNRLISLNEVGGEPDHFGSTPEELHRYFQERQRNWPHALSALSTHDTKRSEDVRARINVLSEMPGEWEDRVLWWGQLNARHRRRVGRLVAPHPNEEYLLYQTLVGAWPMGDVSAEEHATFVKRIQAYMKKAMKEAKVHTSWTSPNEAYDEAVSEFVADVLDEGKSEHFLAEIRKFQKEIGRHGMINSLAQTVVRLTAPGVPDTYQGTELWDLSLVDPDNRRPVDYGHRRRMLEGLRSPEVAYARELVSNMEDGRVKLFVTRQCLHARRQYPGLFSTGAYVPLEVVSRGGGLAFAFMREHKGRAAVVAVPRLRATAPGEREGVIGMPAGWAGREMRNILTGESVRGEILRVADLFEHFPVAVLVAGNDGG